MKKLSSCSIFGVEVGSGICVEQKSSSMKKLSSCSIFGVEVGLIKNKNCAGKIFAIALDILSYTGIKHFISNYNGSIKMEISSGIRMS